MVEAPDTRPMRESEQLDWESLGAYLRARLPEVVGAEVDLTRPLTIEQLRELTDGRGADYVFDTVGAPTTLAQALTLARKGGTIVVTGLARLDTLAFFPLFPFVMQEKPLLGSLSGSGRPPRDVPRLVELYREGRLKLTELATRIYKLEGVNDALVTLAGGKGARGIIRWE